MGGPWSLDQRQDVPPRAERGATIATPLSWMVGSLLLAATVFLVSMIALIRAFVILVS